MILAVKEGVRQDLTTVENESMPSIRNIVQLLHGSGVPVEVDSDA